MSERRLFLPVLLSLVLGLFLGSCSTSDDGGGDVTRVDIPAASMNYIVLAWSDRGMPLMSPTYDREVLLPPYSSLRAQVVRRGDPPEIVTDGITLEYTILGNTSSYGKATADPLRDYSGFWDGSFEIFGVDLAVDTGLNFVDPDVHYGLSGTMSLKGDRFEVDGVPVVPIDDAGTWEPYQVAEIVVRDAATHVELARTQATVPVSDEVSCGKCHGTTYRDQEVLSVLEEHDEGLGTSFAIDGQPVLCADCHGSPALGQTEAGSSNVFLAAVVHGHHSATTAACYDCHPGTETLANRSKAHANDSVSCTTCHGTLATLTTSVTSGRTPWLEEPKCSSCHTFVAEVDTGTELASNGTGHGGLSCSACHGTPHAQVPSNEEADDYQFLQYQGKALSLGSCRVCHSRSKGGGLMGIVIAHGGGEPTACTVCHTAPITTTNPVNFPHRFQWRGR
jgi:hypothetical protein